MTEDKNKKKQEKPAKSAGLEGLVEENDGRPPHVKQPPLTKKGLESTDLPHRIQGG